jgi:hypothetical protein
MATSPLPSTHIMDTLFKSSKHLPSQHRGSQKGKKDMTHVSSRLSFKDTSTSPQEQCVETGLNLETEACRRKAKKKALCCSSVAPALEWIVSQPLCLKWLVN